MTGCNFCACNPEGSIGTYIEELDVEVYHCDDSGQCSCLDGIGGQHCDQCAYGYYEEYLYGESHDEVTGLICQKCDQCFYDWDKSIKELKVGTEK